MMTTARFIALWLGYLACVATVGVFIGASFGAAMANDITFNATVEHVSDGDTIRVVPFGGCRPSILCPLTLRIVGIDTPESRAGGGLGGAKCEKERWLGLKAKVWAKSVLDGKTVLVTTLPKDKQDDPRGRLLANIAVAGVEYSRLAISNGMAAAYDPAKNGFQKPDWCK